MYSNEVAISIVALTKTYKCYQKPADRIFDSIATLFRKVFTFTPTFSKEIHALTSVGFQVLKGETFAIIGRNGAGKSTLLQLIYGTMQPSSGTVRVNGKVAALLELGAGFNPEFTGRENVLLGAAIYGFSKSETEKKLPEIVLFAGIGDFIDRAVKTYSSGMYARLAFALAISVEPDILIIDEALSVGDVFFQAKCMRRIEQMREAGVTILFVSHDLGTVQRICTRAVLLENGAIVFSGDARTACDKFYALNQPTIASEVGSDTVENQDVVVSSCDTVRTNLKEFTPKRDQTTGDSAVTFKSIYSFPNAIGDTINTSVSEWLDFKVHVKVLENLDNFNVGIGLRNRLGELVGGAHTGYVGKNLKKFTKGQSIELRLKFQCNIAPGEYLLLVGAASDFSAGVWIDHCTMWDCMRVSVRGIAKFWGTADLNATVNISEIESEGTYD